MRPYLCVSYRESNGWSRSCPSRTEIGAAHNCLRRRRVSASVAESVAESVAAEFLASRRGSSGAGEQVIGLGETNRRDTSEQL